MFNKMSVSCSRDGFNFAERDFPTSEKKLFKTFTLRMLRGEVGINGFHHLLQHLWPDATQQCDCSQLTVQLPTSTTKLCIAVGLTYINRGFCSVSQNRVQRIMGPRAKLLQSNALRHNQVRIYLVLYQ